MSPVAGQKWVHRYGVHQCGAMVFSERRYKTGKERAFILLGQVQSWIILNNLVPANIAKNAYFFPIIRVSLILEGEAVEDVYATFPNVILPLYFLGMQ